MSDQPTPAPETPAPIVHLYVLLDRSGSMAATADDVISGFNKLLAEQQAAGPDALITLVQFDSQDPAEVVAEAIPILEMTALDAATFQPRGATPLLDATGLLLTRAAARAQLLAADGTPAEDVVVVSITDGHENASSELSLAQVRAMVEDRIAAGWTFVFLGAALDVYGEAGDLGYDTRSTQAFDASPVGTREAFSSLSHATRKHREKVRRGDRFDKGDFFEGDKTAENHRRRDAS